MRFVSAFAETRASSCASCSFNQVKPSIIRLVAWKLAHYPARYNGSIAVGSFLWSVQSCDSLRSVFPSYDVFLVLGRGPSNSLVFSGFTGKELGTSSPSLSSLFSLQSWLDVHLSRINWYHFSRPYVPVGWLFQPLLQFAVFRSLGYIRSVRPGGNFH